MQFIYYIMMWISKIISVLMEFPCTILLVPIVTKNNAWCIILVALGLDTLIGQITYFCAYKQTLLALINSKLFDDAHKLESNNKTKPFYEFHQKIFRHNNFTPYFPPIIVAYSKHNDQTYKYTNFPSYDYTIVAIPENTDLSYLMNQARLAHEMTHGAVHFGMKQMKYSQRFILCVYTGICLIATISLSYWWNIVLICLIPFYIWVSNRELTVKSEIQADNFGLRYIQENYGEFKMKEVANQLLHSRLQFLLRHVPHMTFIELNRIKSLAKYLNNDNRYLLQDVLNDYYDDRCISKGEFNQILKSLNDQESNNAFDDNRTDISIGGMCMYVILLFLTFTSLNGLFEDICISSDILWFVPIIIILIVVICKRNKKLLRLKTNFLQSQNLI